MSPARCMLAAFVITVTWSCSGGDARARKDSIAAARERRCTDTPNAVVSASGVGPIRLGMRVREVAELCPVSDTVAVTAGDSLRTSAVHMGHSIVLLESGGDSIVVNIVLADSAFRTDRGIGVGSRIRTLRFAYGRVCAVDRNGEAVLAVAGLDGLTFSFDPSSLPASVYRTRILGSELRTDAADDLQVREIRIGRFKSPCREQRLANRTVIPRHASLASTRRDLLYRHYSKGPGDNYFTVDPVACMAAHSAANAG